MIKRMLFIDVESSTGNARAATMCSLGYCLVDLDFNIIKKEDIIMKPAVAFMRPKKNGGEYFKFAYSRNVFYRSPDFLALYPKIKDIIEDKEVLVLGYALFSDILYLNSSCKHYKLPLLNFRFLDVQTLLKLEEDIVQFKKLTDYMEEYNIDFQAHRSDEDARATMLLFKNKLNQYGLSFNEFIDKHKIIPGVNSDNDTINEFSINRILSSNTSVKSNAELHILIKAIGNCYSNIIKNGKSFSVGYKEIRLNENLVWNAVAELFSKGYKFTTDMYKSDLILDINKYRYKIFKYNKKVDENELSKIVECSNFSSNEYNLNVKDKLVSVLSNY